MKKFYRAPKPAAERFAKKVQKSDGCWLWIGSATKNGYGQFSLLAVRDESGRMPPGHMKGAHRVAWELANGPIPQGLHVLHRCDVKLCVNPSHLFLGTPSDNMRDAFRKGRHSMRAAWTRSAELRRARARHRVERMDLIVAEGGAL